MPKGKYSVVIMCICVRKSDNLLAHTTIVTPKPRAETRQV